MDTQTEGPRTRLKRDAKDFLCRYRADLPRFPRVQPLLGLYGPERIDLSLIGWVETGQNPIDERDAL